MSTESGPLCFRETSFAEREIFSPAERDHQGSVLLLRKQPVLFQLLIPWAGSAGSSAPCCHYSTDIWWQIPSEEKMMLQKWPKPWHVLPSLTCTPASRPGLGLGGWAQGLGPGLEGEAGSGGGGQARACRQPPCLGAGCEARPRRFGGEPLLLHLSGGFLLGAVPILRGAPPECDRAWPRDTHLSRLLR